MLTYHAVEDGPAPLCVAPELFRAHVRAVVDSGLSCLTVSELAAHLRAGSLPERAVALTFDDGYASVVEHAGPVLAEHGLRATVFCVAGHLGGRGDWPTQAAWAPSLRVAGAPELAQLVDAGWEVGSHGVHHEPLDRAGEEAAEREVVESRRMLEAALGTDVRSFAWPYGAQPSPAAARRIAETYDAACAPGPAAVRPGADPLAMPRVDSHYLRRPDLLRRALAREPQAYLALRRAGGRLRRAVRPDHSPSSRA